MSTPSKGASPQQGQQAPPKQNGGAIQKLTPQQEKVLAIGRLIESKRDALALVAGKHFDATRLVKLGQAAITRNPKIAQCNTATVLVCLMRAAELNLEPDAALPQRRMWLVPRKNNKLPEGMELTYVIDYRAKIQLARDTGLVPSITADVVYEKDKFSYVKSPDGESITKLTHEPDPFIEDRGKVRGYYAMARIGESEVQAVVWGVERMRAFQKRHASSDDPKSPWVRDFDAMAMKTMLNQLFNLLPAGQSAEARRLQEITAEENAIEVEGKRVGVTEATTGAVDLGIVPEVDEGGTTDEQVEAALAGGKAAAAAAKDTTLDAGKDPKSMEKPAEKKAAKEEPGADG